MEKGRDLIQGGLEIICVLAERKRRFKKAKQLINEIKTVSIVKCHLNSDAVKESQKKKLKGVNNR